MGMMGKMMAGIMAKASEKYNVVELVQMEIEDKELTKSKKGDEK